ncbi:LOW QUALITY PROTEIN: hypothetical protein PHMEG_00033644 [Phytophthora megakarya]|uniref:Uncharacterized protein n=1 Tax=Phytophthora megakarya TaxID=4795 RepID=A0A225USV2_9STRA|nr:LOW QUALITY PROTEIN: hypothetical protein PHMEG_00033644 [Phytophthora megakarya]
MRWIFEGQGIHHLVPREAVCRMLAQVIHADQLDETPWCRFVPDGFFLRDFTLEGTLRLRHAKRESTPPWHPLGRCYIKVQRRKQSTRETEAIQSKLPESSDDEVQDPSYELSQEELDEAARSEAAADNDESSEDSNNTEKESKPATTHLSPGNFQESKTRKTNDKGSDSKSHDASASRVITGSEPQPIPKSNTTRKRKMPVLSLATFLRRAKVEIPSDGPRRTRSKLAKLSYDDLHNNHLDMVEAACRETHVSYRIFGILVKFDPYQQSQGYPDFESHKPDIHVLKERWDLEAYQALVYVPEPVNGHPPRGEDGEIIRAPWSVMFHCRVTVLYFHEVRDLNSGTLDGIKDYVDFMRINAKTWTFLYEPGLWTLPVCACHWILKDPACSPHIRRGVADYAAQLDDLDVDDPIRTQWAAPHTDDDILATVPAFMHPLLMMPERRARNVIPLSAASQA